MVSTVACYAVMAGCGEREKKVSFSWIEASFLVVVIILFLKIVRAGCG